MIELINRQITQRLQTDYQLKPAGAYLRGGLCPECGKKSLWTWTEKPGSVQCDRTGKCGFIATSKELFPELFANFNKNYQATNEEPNRTANAYMSISRGFDLGKIGGWYEQGKYWNPNADKGTATVRFWLDAEKTVYWERFIEDVTITDPADGSQTKRTSAFKGAFGGLWWMPPGQRIEVGDKVYLTEGIFKAIALVMMGYKAVSIMSAGSFPDAAFNHYVHKGVTWVLALDNDEAGRKATRKHAKKIRSTGEKVTCILSSEDSHKLDWDDLYKAGKLEKADMAQYAYFGRLELTQTVIEKAQIIWERDAEKSYFCMLFRNSTYSVKINLEELEKAKKEMLATDTAREEKAVEHAFISVAKVHKIATFKMDFLYYQEPENGDEEKYFFKVEFENHSEQRKIALAGKVFKSASSFLEAMLRYPGGKFEGSSKDILYLYGQWQANAPKVVKAIDFVGYHKGYNCYIFNEYAVYKDKVYPINADSYFQLEKLSIKSTHEIKQKLTTSKPSEFWPDYRTAFGVKGIVTMAAWLGAAFAEQISEAIGFYPFYEIWGDPDSGKSSMIIFLWKLYGRNNAVFNPNESTAAGRLRTMCEVGNLPVVFNEVDHQVDDNGKTGHQTRFKWEHLKDIYERNTGSRKGAMNSGNSNKTHQPEFKGAVFAIQNPHIYSDEATLTRWVSLYFDKSHHSRGGYEASKRLELLKITDVCGFFLHLLQHTSKVLARVDEKYRGYVAFLQKKPELKMNRIIHNHALMMALVDCLPLVLPVTAADIREANGFIERLAFTKQEELNQDHPTVQQFWANFDVLNSDYVGSALLDNLMNHSNEPEIEIAVNLELFNQACEKHNLPRIGTQELRKLLPTSRDRKYIDNKVVHSRLLQKKVRCYLFKRPN